MAKEKRPMLSISLLASNRPDTIRRCLDSLKPIMEQISSELILVDTSEREEIHKILTEYTNKVITFHWCNDFAKARNAGLKEAKGEWFLFLDDDEWFTEPEALIDFFQSGESEKYGCANYLVRNFYDAAYTRYTDCWASRLIRRYEDTHFESKIHEYLVPVRGECQNIPARAYHTGYIFGTQEEREKHFRRNETLLKEMIAEEPNRLRWKVQLVQEYRSVNKFDELFELCDQYLEEYKSITDEKDLMDYGTFYAAKADGKIRSGAYIQAVQVADAGIEDAGMNELCRAFLYLQKAIAYDKLREWSRAKDAILHYMKLFGELKENPRRREKQKSALIVADAFETENLRLVSDLLTRCEKKETCQLTISMLVSGREETTERSIQSFLPLLEGINSELILVDTGCTEEYRKKLEQYTKDIIAFTWCNDFAKARNAGLEKASGEWFMFLDDDEWFDDVMPIVEFFASGEYKNYNQAVYKVRNYSDPDGAEYMEEWASRLIKIEKDTRFEGKVHEALVPVAAPCKRIDAFVHHFGYVYATEEERLAHQKRNISLLLDLIKEEPDNMRWPIHLIKEYLQAEMWDDLVEISRQTLKRMEGYDEAYANQIRGSFYTAILYAEYKRKRYEKVHSLFAQYIEDSNLNEIGKCSLYLYEIEALYDEVNENDNLNCWKAIAKYSKQYILNWKLQDAKTYDEQSRTIQDSLVLVNHSVKEEFYSWVRNVWMIAQSRLQKVDSKVEEYVLEAQNDLLQWMQGKGEFLAFDETYWRLYEENLCPLEHILLSLPLSQWMALVYALQKGCKAINWEEASSRLKEISTKDDIRYSYFFMNYYNYILEQRIEFQRVEQIENLIREACDWNLKYAKEVYADKAFEGNMEMLPDSCRAAVYLEKAIACSMEERSAKFELLGMAVKAQPKLADMVKTYAKLLGEEQERQSKAAKQADDELHQMAAEVLKQVDVLLQNKMYADALAIVRQLRQMLPADNELIALEEELEKVGK